MLVVNGTHNPKPGRPKTARCKRGHERVPGEAQCKQCRNLRYTLKYHNNPEFRERKKKIVAAYRKRFREENGIWPSELYR